MWTTDSIPLSTLVILLLFGSIALTYVVANVLKLTPFALLPVKLSSVSKPPASRVGVLQATAASFLDLWRELTLVGVILLYAWVCENRPWYDQGKKEHDMDFYWFLSVLLIAVALCTPEKDHKGADDLVNRDQTEEWKGWMQVAFLLYHYFEASEVYNSIRVMISCYVWMTGFGNLSFFYIKRDFGFVRFYQMFWRLNFLVVLLCMTMNNMYILYYICPLHTFYFLLTFVTMRIYPNLNHTKYGMRIKMMAVGFVVWAIWEFPPVFNFVFGFLNNDPHPGAAVGAYGVRYEWQFRSGLDHWSTYFGMIFALNFPQATLWFKQVEKLSTTKQVVIKGVPAVLLVCATIFYVKEILPLPKYEYNALHPYVFIIPLSTILFLRNITSYLRQYHLTVLASIGKVTLETYLMQHHIWLTSNAKTLLEFIPGYPKLNFILVTIVYVLVSRRLYRLTISLRARLIPETPSDAFAWMVAVVGILGVFFVAGGILQHLALGWFGVACVLIASAVVFLLNASMIIRNEAFPSSRTITLVFAPFALIALASPFVPVLSSYVDPGPVLGLDCLDYVNNGFYSHDSVFCHGADKAFCASERWQWDAPKTCRLSNQSAAKSLALLSGDRVKFVGGHDVFNLYRTAVAHLDASSPVMHLVSAGAEKTTVTAGEASVELVYVPISSSAKAAAELQKVDGTTVYVLGVGYKQKVAQKATASGNAVIALPEGVVASVVVSESEASSEVVDALSAVGVTSLVRLDTLVKTGLKLSDSLGNESVYVPAMQIWLNSVDVVKKDIKAKALANAPTAARSYNGISHNPMLGLALLGLAAWMLVSMDNFAFSYLTKPIFGQSVQVTWEESVEKLHRAIFKTDDIENRESENREEAGEELQPLTKQ